MKKTLRETQTLCIGYSKVESKIFAPPQTPSQRAGRPKFNQLEMVTTFTYRPSLVRIDARNFELSWWQPTNKQTQRQTHRQDQLQYTASQLVRSVNTGLQSEAHNLISFIKNSVKLTTSTKLSTFVFASFLFGSYNSLCCM